MGEGLGHTMRYCEWSGLPPPNLIPSSDFGPSPAWVSPSGENRVFVHSYSGQGPWQVWGWEGRVVSVYEVRARGGGARDFGATSTVETSSFAAVAPLSSFAGSVPVVYFRPSQSFHWEMSVVGTEEHSS